MVINDNYLPIISYTFAEEFCVLYIKAVFFMINFHKKLPIFKPTLCTFFSCRILHSIPIDKPTIPYDSPMKWIVLFLIKIECVMNSLSKVIIYPKDVAIITGKSYRASWQLLKKIHAYYKKDKHQVVTVQEFCEYMGIGEDAVSKVM